MRQEIRYIASGDIHVTFHGGQNAQENWALLDTAAATDLWFHHATDPSCHVIARTPVHLNKALKRKIALQGALLCQQWSSHHRTAHHVPILYTTVQHVTKGERVGSVHTGPCTTVVVKN
jgi:predicted ribosome quality control (RQC) complex YloA/Tae2 family protein